MVSGGETPILEVIMALTKSGHSEGQGFLTEALRAINTRGSVVQTSRLSILRLKKKAEFILFSKGDGILEYSLLKDCLIKIYFSE